MGQWWGGIIRILENILFGTTIDVVSSSNRIHLWFPWADSSRKVVIGRSAVHLQRALMAKQANSELRLSGGWVGGWG